MKKNTRFGTLTVIAALAIIGLLALPVSAKNISSRAGTTGFSFLKLGVGAKAVAMGGAFTAIADDPSAVYYNPSGTIHLKRRELLAGYHNYVLDIQSGFIAYSQPLLEKYSLGFFIDYLNFGDFTQTNINGERIGEFSGSDFLIGTNFSTKIIPELAAGINFKYMHEGISGVDIQGESSNPGADAIAFDLGFHFKMPDSLTTFGFMAYNLGGIISGYSANHKDKLPMGVRLGLSHSLRELPLRMALDGVLPNDNDPYFNIGTEFYKFEPLYLRLGYSLFGENYKTGSNSDGWGGISAGFGLDIRDYHFAYAFMPYLDLGSSHRVTISGEF